MAIVSPLPPPNVDLVVPLLLLGLILLVMVIWGFLMESQVAKLLRRPLSTHEQALQSAGYIIADTFKKPQLDPPDKAISITAQGFAKDLTEQINKAFQCQHCGSSRYLVWQNNMPLAQALTCADCGEPKQEVPPPSL